MIIAYSVCALKHWITIYTNTSGWIDNGRVRGGRTKRKERMHYIFSLHNFENEWNIHVIIVRHCPVSLCTRDRGVVRLVLYIDTRMVSLCSLAGSVWKNDGHWIGEIHIFIYFKIPQAIPIELFRGNLFDVWILCCSVRAVATLSLQASLR